MTNQSDASLRNRHEILVKTRFLRPSLSKAEKKAADCLMEDPRRLLTMTLGEFAAAAQCSQASVVRFCRSLGFDGFSDLKLQLSSELAVGEPDTQFEEVTVDDGPAEIMEKVFRINIQILKDTLTLSSHHAFDQALQALSRAKSIALFGIGDAAVPCYFADVKFKRLGIRTAMHTDPDLQLIVASLLGPGDVAIAISHSGRSSVIVEAMRLAREGGATTICITKFDRSPLARICDIKLFTATADATIGREIVARRVAEQAILESLYLGLLAKKGPETLEKLKRTTKAVEFNKL